MITGRLSRAGDQACLVPKVLKTSNFFERMRGLLGRSSLQRNEAMLILPCSAVHTIGMGYPIDLVFLDRNWTIIKTITGLKPWRMASHPSATMVLETAEGGVETMQLHEGTRLVWQDR